MAKMDYNAINFKNKDVDKFANKFGKTLDKKTPEEQAKQDEIRTKGMTQNEINVYNQKGNLGKKHFAKVTAKKHLKKEEADAKPVVVVDKPLTSQEREALKVSKNSRVVGSINAVSNLINPFIEGTTEYLKFKAEQNSQSQP